MAAAIREIRDQKKIAVEKMKTDDQATRIMSVIWSRRPFLKNGLVDYL
jgi:hypothetical protein